MYISNMKKSCEIFEKYVDDYFSAEHDCIYGPDKDKFDFNEDEKKKLDELGWFIDEYSDCWMCYT